LWRVSGRDSADDRGWVAATGNSPGCLVAVRDSFLLAISHIFTPLPGCIGKLWRGGNSGCCRWSIAKVAQRWQILVTAAALSASAFYRRFGTYRESSTFLGAGAQRGAVAGLRVGGQRQDKYSSKWLMHATVALHPFAVVFMVYDKIPALIYF